MQRKRPMLTREKICESAIELIAKEGLESLSMRKLAVNLGVEAPSLYKHISSKAELFDLIQENLIRQLVLSSKASSWQRYLQETSASMRQLLLKSPNIAPLFATRPAISESAIVQANEVFGILSDAGFKYPDIVFAYKSLCTFILGHVLAEVGRVPGSTKEESERKVSFSYKEKFPNLAKAYNNKASKDHDRWFNFGIKTIISGLEIILAKS